MFTGVIQHVGRLKEFRELDNQWELVIQCPDIAKELHKGNSLSVDGACLTVKEIGGDCIYFDVLQETYQKTHFSRIGSRASINLELPLKTGDPLDGHFVTGHIDGYLKILEIIERAHEKEFKIEAAPFVAPYIVSKGSVALDGVSLTVGEVTDCWFSVYLIPITLEKSNLGKKIKGDLLNIEVDILARYGYLPASSPDSGISEKFLREHGFC